MEKTMLSDGSSVYVINTRSGLVHLFTDEGAMHRSMLFTSEHLSKAHQFAPITRNGIEVENAYVLINKRTGERAFVLGPNTKCTIADMVKAAS